MSGTPKPAKIRKHHRARNQIRVVPVILGVIFGSIGYYFWGWELLQCIFLVVVMIIVAFCVVG